MTMELDYDPDQGILRVAARGRVDLDEYRQTLERITSGKDYPSTVPTIWDLREVDFEGIDRTFAETVSAVRAEFTSRRKARIAYVVRDALAYGMMRMFTALTDTADPREAMVTYDYADAEAWLRGPPGKPEGS